MREASKFVFTKILSRILEVVAEYAQSIKITRHEISFFTIQEIISFYQGTIFDGKLTELREEMKRRQKLRKIEKCVTLPLLLFDAENIVIAPFFTKSAQLHHKRNCIWGDQIHKRIRRRYRTRGQDSSY